MENVYKRSFESAPPPQNISKTKGFGFTLAEILITLGIIGVVAALTIPNLITNYQKKVTATELKKAYSEIAQAIKLSQIQNGELNNWNFTLSGRDFYYQYLQKYFIKNKEIPNNEFKRQYIVKNMNGTQCTGEVWCTQNDSFYIYLPNGSIMGIMTHIGQTKYKSVTIDINGLKAPNQIGKDFFVFSITSPDGLVPYGYKDGGMTSGNFGDMEKSKLTGTDNYACNKAKKGIWCSALIMLQNWEITKDYPW